MDMRWKVYNDILRHYRDTGRGLTLRQAARDLGMYGTIFYRHCLWLRDQGLIRAAGTHGGYLPVVLGWAIVAGERRPITPPGA